MWTQGPTGKAWIQAHPSIRGWLDRLSKETTRSAYAHDFYLFCKSTGKTPEELIALRKGHANGWNITEMLEDFILHGKYEDERIGHQGEISEISHTSKNRRKALYTGVRSFFASTHGDNGPLSLPDDKAFKIKENDNREPTTGYITLDQANAIIGTMKEPYRTLFTIAKYAGMGNNELVYLNRLWPDMRKQLKDGRDPIRVDYRRRKNNERPFFTLIPSRLLKPYEDSLENPFQSKDEQKGRKATLKPVKNYDLWIAWKAARKRAGIVEDVKPHHLRDLLITLGFKIGLRKESTDFLTGHTVDTNGYLQIMRESDALIKEWGKIRSYIDSGVSTETQEKMAKLEKQADTRDKEIKNLRIEIRRMQIDQIERKLHIGRGIPITEIEIPDPSEEPVISDEQEKRRKEEIEEYQDYKEGELAGLARLKKELANLESS
jgi:hypothetical protein